MGLDGGTKISRTDILRGQSWAVANSDTSRSTRGGAVQAGYLHQSKEISKKDRAEACWSACALSGAALRSPVAACWLGRLYNKEAVIEHILARQGSFVSEEATYAFANRLHLQEEFGHLKTLKDIFNVHLTHLQTDEMLDGGLAATHFGCPVLHLRAGAPGVEFQALSTCGHVISERALRQIDEQACPLCSQTYVDADVVPLYGNPEQVSALWSRNKRL
ncbi:hypothetical protein CYMTET_14428 [Cymbomonas tetramitiformis]|uniref:Replication termination factor 2 n=1 Tax=Cymbomonas tetramitiformis TaxID=36881 RepID=A0AAE0GGE0_9CHLO|nr:hypothetical protein CYMTET_14428 [Cymbomonas tetramitiformis]